MSRSRVFERYKRFSEGREGVEEDEHPGRPSTSKTDPNIQRISEIVRKYQRLIVRKIADMVGFNKETNCVEEAAESLVEQRRDAASGQCPSSQHPFGQEVSSR